MSVLDTLLNTIQNNKEKKQAGTSGWVGTLIASVLALIVTAIFAYKAWKSGKELAKLQHEKVVREEQAHQAEVDSFIKTDEDEKQKALNTAEELKEEIAILEEEAARLEGERNKSREIIKNISNWDDVDAFIK